MLISRWGAPHRRVREAIESLPLHRFQGLYKVVQLRSSRRGASETLSSLNAGASFAAVRLHEPLGNHAGGGDGTSGHRLVVATSRCAERGAVAVAPCGA